MKFLTLSKNKLQFYVAAGVSLALLFFYTLTTFAAINPEINYQGKLVDNVGALVADGAYSMEFRFYTVATSGTAIWNETQSVTVTDGLFSVLLGDVSSLSGVDFDQTLYLGIEVASDGEMTPRKRIGSVPTAFVAETANDAELLSGIASSSFVRSDAADTVSASSSSTLLSIVQSGSGNVFNLFSGATEIFTALNDGNIGIGTTTPSSKLSVAGDLYVTGAFRDSGNSAGTNGYVLLSTGTGTDWVATSSLGIGGGGTLGSLSDVTLTAPGSGEFLSYNGSAWVNVAAPSGGSLFTDSGTLTYLTSTTDNLAVGTSTQIGSARLTVDGDVTVSEGNAYRIGTRQVLTLYDSPFIGYVNLFVGSEALNIDETTAYENTAVGVRALQSLTTGSNNTALGLGALQTATSSGSNTAIGSYSLSNTNSGGQNTAVGSGSLGSNTNGSNNTAVGQVALADNTIGNDNTALGAGALSITTSGNNNVAVGRQTAEQLTTGSQNTLLGMRAGGGPSWLGWTGITTGSNNIAIGYESMVASSTASNQLSIGNLIFGTGLDGTGTTLSTGNIGIGTTTPSSKLSVAGDLYVTGAFRDSGNSAGTNGYVLLSTGTGTDWVATSSLGITGGGGGGVTTVYKNTVENVISSTTLQDDDELFFSVGADEQWAFRFAMFVNSATAADLRVAVTGPTGATCRYGVQDVENAVSVVATTCGAAITAIATSGTTPTTEDIYEVVGTIDTASASGIVRLQWAQQTSNASNTTVHPGSYVTAYPVGAAGGGSGSLWSENASDIYYTAGNVGIGTPTPTQDLHVAGNARIEGALYDSSNSAGTSGYVLQTTGTGFSWVATSSLGIGGGGTLGSLSDVTLTAPGSGEFLSYNGSAWVNVAAPSGGSLFTDSGTLTYLTSTTDNLAVGTSTQIGSARLTVDGDIAIPLGSAFMVGTETVLRKYDGAYFGPTNLYVGSTAGSINSALAFNNTALGQESLTSLTDGQGNTALGAGTLQSLTVGGGNVAVGQSSMQSGSGGHNNTAVGASSLQNNTGNDNTAVGVSALNSNTSGQDNAAVGAGALYSNTTGTYNVAIGKNALQANVSSNNSVAIGFNALANSTAGDNTAIGIGSLGSNTTGAQNLGLGGYSLQSNTTGSNNVALGAFALSSNVGGGENVAIGENALSSNVSGEYNIAIGKSTGRDITGASSSGANTMIGFNTGRGVTTGTNNTIIGANVTGLSAALSNTIILADGSGNQRLFIDSDGDVGIKQTTPNTALHVGGTGVTDGTSLLTLQDANSTCVFNADTGSPTCGSDIRLKKDVRHIENELETILALEPKFWRFKSDNSEDRRTLRSGFIAQEVEKVLPELVSENTWIDGSKKKFLNISGMIPYIVGAIKELWAEVRENRTRIETLEAQIESLKAQIGTQAGGGAVHTPDQSSGGAGGEHESEGEGEGGGESEVVEGGAGESEGAGGGEMEGEGDGSAASPGNPVTDEETTNDVEEVETAEENNETKDGEADGGESTSTGAGTPQPTSESGSTTDGGSSSESGSTTGGSSDGDGGGESSGESSPTPSGGEGGEGG